MQRRTVALRATSDCCYSRSPLFYLALSLPYALVNSDLASFPVSSRAVRQPALFECLAVDLASESLSVPREIRTGVNKIPSYRAEHSELTSKD